MPIRHVVIWKIAAEDQLLRSEQIAAFRSALESLPAVIADILSLQVGVNVLSEDANWHLTLIADFADEAGLRTYEQHPEHQAVVAQHKHIFAARAAVDYQF